MGKEKEIRETGIPIEKKQQEGSEETKGISRRSFLTGGAVLGATVVASTALGACSPQQSSSGTSSSGASGGKTLKEGQYAFEIPPDPIPESKITETVEVDVVVVGAGLSGTFAALAAAEEGASVIVLQKSSIPVTHGIGWSIFDSELQREAGNEYDLKAWTDYFTKASYGYANQAYVESIVYNSGRAADMLDKHVKKRAEGFGSITAFPRNTMCMWNGPEVTNGYSRVPVMVNKMIEICSELGVKYYYSCPALQLEKEGDRVVAVIAENEAGSGYFRAKAAKGVILSTGDIGNDPDMVAKYAPFCQGVLNTYAPPDNTGDGHKMALWVGARMFSGPFTHAIHYDPSPLPEGDAPFSGSPYLAVNARGLRYQNEDHAYPMIANLNVQQPDKLRWQIIDNTFTEYWNDFVPGMCRNAGFAFNSNQEAYDACLKNGAIKKADTLEEIADIIGFQGNDRTNFFATIKRYNELADKGIDEDFGKNPDYLVKTAVRNGPFYSIKRSPGPLALIDGVYSTPKMEVLDNDMNVIPGLFASGNVVHSMFGCDYTISPGGISCGHAISSGYVAGKASVGKLPDYKSYYKAPTGEGTLVAPPA